MLPYVETLYVSGPSPADQEKILNSSTASSLVSPCHGHLPAAPFPSYPWFPMSPFAFDQGLVFPIDEEAALIVEEELNASPDVTLPSDPPPADYMVDVNTTLAGATGTAMAAALAAPQAADAAAAAFPEDKRNSVKKRFRTDRHSKIHTSQGLRDRRMRLSLDVARQFFDLQDMLGFDKASQTISWLLTQSKMAIEQLTATRSSPGATGQAFNSPHSSFGSNDSSSDGEAVSPNPKPPSGGLLPLDAVALEAKSAKESRNKARARARQRTMEKNRKRIGCKSLLGDASAMDYQLVAPSKTSTVAAAGASAAAATADHNFEQPATWNGMTEHNPITTIPSEYLWSNHEAVSFMEEELKITESGNKHEDMVISWLM